MADPTARTEPATPARRDEARRHGDVAASPAIAPAAVACTALGLGVVGAPVLMQRLRAMLVDWLAAAGPTAIADGPVSPLAWRTAHALAGVLAPFFVLVALVAFGVTVAQVGLRPRALRADATRLTAGWRRLWSADGLARLVKVVVELVLVLGVGWLVMRHVGAGALDAAAMPIDGVLALAAEAGRALGLAIGAVLIAVAAADYAWARWRRERRLAMSREELREESKRRDGAPHVRARLRRAHRAIAGRSMPADVAGADVVLASPAEVAVALRYRADEGRAPRVLSVGAGLRADGIAAAARTAGVPIVVRPELARTIARAVPSGGEIPPACYPAVADVLALLAASTAGEAR
jgi:flagellar biosynthetic protein FlhB